MSQALTKKTHYICGRCRSPISWGRCTRCGWRDPERIKRDAARRKGKWEWSRHVKAAPGGRARVTRIVQLPDGPLAYVKCPECKGFNPSCTCCNGKAEISLLMFHRWRQGKKS